MDLGSESWTRLLLQLFLDSSATDIVFVTLLKQKLRNTLAASQWRGPHCLNIAVVLAGVPRPSRSSEGRTAQTSHSLFIPFPPPTPLSPSLISHLASVDVKQHVYLLTYSLTLARMEGVEGRRGVPALVQIKYRRQSWRALFLAHHGMRSVSR